ncbi:FKBP-type peptidyl-prolyl cis-trans isomerase [Candidatus Gugararchaeum adminiculabundum]|nr:FKBP-type peptidyl-prolyl cis-trans isomerase [Candidatus Gugararchaeum adminiculabundum]
MKNGRKFAPIAIALIFVFALILAGCAQGGNSGTNNTANSTPAKNDTIAPVNSLVVQAGDNVSVEYIGKLENGTVFDTNMQDEAVKAGLPLRPVYEPLQFTAGAGRMIKGFDEGVIGMKVGETKTLTIAPEDAYGQPDPKKIISVELSKIPNGDKLKVGDTLYTAQGMPGKVIAIDNGNAEIDFNHQLAGKTLVFEVTVKGIEKKK